MKVKCFMFLICFIISIIALSPEVNGHYGPRRGFRLRDFRRDYSPVYRYDPYWDDVYECYPVRRRPRWRRRGFEINLDFGGRGGIGFRRFR